MIPYFLSYVFWVLWFKISAFNQNLTNPEGFSQDCRYGLGYKLKNKLVFLVHL